MNCAPERSGFPSRAGAAGSNHLPWALLRILQAIPKIKRPAGGRVWRTGRGRGGVCSKDVSEAFGPVKHSSVIAAADAERARDDGRGGRPRKNTGRHRRPEESERGKAGATGSASKIEKYNRRKWFKRPRGSSLRKTFFDGCCDRPGCYEGFVRQRRSPLQRFCSHPCRRAMERVWERERRWHETHAS